MAYKPHNLGWSNTRITVLEYCQKKYFFNYYTHSLKDIDETIWLEGLMVKHLKSMEMRMGEKTHHILSDYIKLLKSDKVTGDTISQLKTEITDVMKQEFASSKNRNYSLSYNKDEKFGLSEHYYGIDVDDRLEDITNKVLANFDAFLASDWHEKIKRYFQIAKQVFIENPKVPDYDGMKVNVSHIPELLDISILASPDFGVIFDDNNYLILDRKSGKEPLDSIGVSDQLKIYVLKMLLKKGTLNLGDIKVKAFEIYLPSMNSIGGDVVQKDIDDVVDKIIQDVDYQKQFIQDNDPIKNLPMSHKTFQRTTSFKKCDSCSFKKICDDLKNKE